MRAPSHLLLAALALCVSRAFAADTATAGFLTDSSGDPVLSSTDRCWRTGAWTPGMAGACRAGAGSANAAAVPANTRALTSRQSGRELRDMPAGASASGVGSGSELGYGLTDSSGQPVRNGFGQCWGTGFSTPDPSCAAAAGSAAAAPAPIAPSLGTTGRDGQADMLPAASGTATSGNALAPANARGNPGYLTDSRGFVVRSGSGECWHTGSWTPALATVVGCDGVLAKAEPVPAPAPSPQAEPPTSEAPEPEADALAQGGPPAEPVPPAAPAPIAPEAQTPLEPLIAPELQAAPGSVQTPSPPIPAIPEAGAPSTTEPPSLVDTPPEQPAPAPSPPSTAATPEPRRAAPPAPPPSPPSPPAAAAAELEPSQPAEQQAEAVPPTSEQAQQPKSEKVVLETDTYFDFDKSTLKPAGKRKLDELASRLFATELEVIVATGHTDWIGTDQYNQKLSERRARAVQDYLTDKGIPANRIFTEGKGERQPVATNKTPRGRALNRRVEVEVVGIRRPESR